MIWEIALVPPTPKLDDPGQLERLKKTIYSESLELHLAQGGVLRWLLYQLPVHGGFICGFAPPPWHSLDAPIIHADLDEARGPKSWWLKLRGADHDDVRAIKLPTKRDLQ